MLYQMKNMNIFPQMTGFSCVNAPVSDSRITLYPTWQMRPNKVNYIHNSNSELQNSPSSFYLCFILPARPTLLSRWGIKHSTCSAIADSHIFSTSMSYGLKIQAGYKTHIDTANFFSISARLFATVSHLHVNGHIILLCTCSFLAFAMHHIFFRSVWQYFFPPCNLK